MPNPLIPISEFIPGMMFSYNFNHSNGSNTPEGHISASETGTDTYDIYQLSYTNIDPVTDGVSLRGRLSTDNGGSFIATAYKTGYYYNKIGGSGSSQSGSSQSSYFSDTLTYGNDAGFQHGGVITFYGLRSSNHHKVLIQTQVINGTNGVPYHTAQNWYIENTNKMNHIEMSFSSGNISVGSFSFYGLAK